MMKKDKNYRSSNDLNLEKKTSDGLKLKKDVKLVEKGNMKTNVNGLKPNSPTVASYKSLKSNNNLGVRASITNKGSKVEDLGERSKAESKHG